jgi:hypothetical protein
MTSSYPTYAVSTELDAVNQILSSVGQAPVTTLDQQNPEVSIALNTLREANKQVQAEGWTFNTEHHYELTGDANTFEITYPTNALQIDTTRSQHFDDYDPVRRGGKLYDRHKHTFLWKNEDGTAKTIQVDVIWYFNFTEVPIAVQNYITSRACVMSALKMVGDKELMQLLNQQEINTRAAALEYETSQGDFTMFGFKDGENYHNSYQPYAALQR